MDARVELKWNGTINVHTLQLSYAIGNVQSRLSYLLYL